VQKTFLEHNHHPATSSSNEWFGVEAIAGIEVTSEAEDAAVENVLFPDRGAGWRAGEPGPQIIRITFSGPTNIRRIHLFSGNRSSQERRNLRSAVPLLEGKRQK
jgi:hypothetical protein